MIATPDSVTTVHRPADRFYWAVLDAPGLRSRPGASARPLPPGLLAELADQIPQPLDEVWAVGLPIGDGRMLVCAARRDDLNQLDAGARALVPESLPPGIDRALADRLSSFNLLVGDFEPAPVRRDRWRRHRAWAGLVVPLAVLVSVGLIRRAAHWSDVARAAEESQSQLAADLLGPGIPLEQVNYTLDAELDRLRELARARPADPNDASVRLATLLRSWPAVIPSKPQSVSVNDSGVTVSVSVDGDPAPFLSAFKAPEGWALDEPRLNQAGELTRLTLHLHRKPPPPDAPANPPEPPMTGATP
ncbi:MAG: hypothetical protein IT436_04175 [Phycisphaerales bacterium]|nr:hypothetical protein [Phycisphaerales bacterium]